MSAVHVDDLSPSIARALGDAFGPEPATDLCILKGGRSGATLLSLTVAGAAYVVRRADPARPWHEPRLARELACMKIASDTGVAPKLRHLDRAAGVAIMEWIPQAAPARGPQRLERVARTVRRLHDGPPFPVGASVMGLVGRVEEMLRARGSDGLPPALVRTMGEVAAATAQYAESAPCHSDLNPGNVLETHDAVYFVDWETAGMSDPYLDLAQLGVFGFPAPDERAALLEAYLGRGPSEHERARTTLARVMALGFFSAAFVLSMAVAGRVDLSATPLSVPDVIALLASARAHPDLASPSVVAASLLEEMRREAETDAYQAAMRVLAHSG